MARRSNRTATGLNGRVRWPASYRPNRVRFDGLTDGLERTGAIPNYSSLTIAFGFRPLAFLGTGANERGRFYQAIDQLSPSTGDYTQVFRLYWDHTVNRLGLTVWNETAEEYDYNGTFGPTLSGYHYVVFEYVVGTAMNWWLDGVAQTVLPSSYPGPILGSLVDEQNIGTGQVGIVPRINHFHGDLDDLWVGYNQTPGIDAFWPRRNLGDGNITGQAPEVWLAGNAVDWNAGRNRGSQTGWALTSEANGLEDVNP